jgi:hypothetical protein
MHEYVSIFILHTHVLYITSTYYTPVRMNVYIYIQEAYNIVYVYPCTRLCTLRYMLC